jgi:hypothetical protein
MKYPAIVYAREATETTHADNAPYTHTRRYQVTVISRNPDTDIIEKVGALPMCSHTRFFARNGLNHDVFTLYF